MKKSTPLIESLTLVFNRYIRLRDSVDGWGSCISCAKVVQFGTSEWHAGHFIPSTYSPVRFDERNVNGQCKRCNRYKRGNLIEYRAALEKKIGKDQVEELLLLRNMPWKWDAEWLEEKILYYKNKCKNWVADDEVRIRREVDDAILDGINAGTIEVTPDRKLKRKMPF